MTICEVVNAAHTDRKRWGNPPTIESLSACTDAVSGRMVEFKNLLLIDTYDEAYLRAMGLDFIRMSAVTVVSLSVRYWTVIGRDTVTCSSAELNAPC